MNKLDEFYFYLKAEDINIKILLVYLEYFF